MTTTSAEHDADTVYSATHSFAKEKAVESPCAPLAVCPYSEETVTACRYYRPRSEHGDAPDAASCRHALVIHVSSAVRRRHCLIAAR